MRGECESSAPKCKKEPNSGQSIDAIARFYDLRTGILEQQCTVAPYFQLRINVSTFHAVRCLPTIPASSNIVTCGLPNTASSLASALMLRLLAASCRLFALI